MRDSWRGHSPSQPSHDRNLELIIWLFNRNTSLGEREMPWASVSTAFSSSPKHLRVFLSLDRNTENIFSISFRGKKENNFLTLIIKLWILFAHEIITLTACTSSVFLSSYRKIFSKGCFLNVFNERSKQQYQISTNVIINLDVSFSVYTW